MVSYHFLQYLKKPKAGRISNDRQKSAVIALFQKKHPVIRINHIETPKASIEGSVVNTSVICIYVIFQSGAALAEHYIRNQPFRGLNKQDKMRVPSFSL